MEESFKKLCREGKLEEAQKIYNENNINIHAVNNEAFRDACFNGHIEIVKWLINLDDKPYIHANNDEAFRSACFYGHIEIAKWLINLDDKPDIHAVDDFAFIYACFNGHIEIAKWLMTLDDKPNIHANNDCVFRFACCNGHIEIAKWLINLDDKPNIHANNDEAFRYACFYGHIEMAKWLVTICDDYYIEIKNNKIKSYKIKNRLQDLFDNKEYDKIIDKLKIQRKEIIIDKEDKCCICFTEEYNFLSSCNHCFCLECFLIWNIKHDKKECCYCKQNIIIEKCIVKS
jgi:ankyrin repeat protein